MKKQQTSGFFCVVYFDDTKKTCYYRKVYTPSKLARTLKNWKWIKIFINKEDYFNDTKTTNYHAIFDDENQITEFNYRHFNKK